MERVLSQSPELSLTPAMIPGKAVCAGLQCLCWFTRFDVPKQTRALSTPVQCQPCCLGRSQAVAAQHALMQSLLGCSVKSSASVKSASEARMLLGDLAQFGKRRQVLTPLGAVRWAGVAIFLPRRRARRRTDLSIWHPATGATSAAGCCSTPRAWERSRASPVLATEGAGVPSGTLYQ